jgi:hypothetical protein
MSLLHYPMLARNYLVILLLLPILILAGRLGSPLPEVGAGALAFRLFQTCCGCNLCKVLGTDGNKKKKRYNDERLQATLYESLGTTGSTIS